MLALALLQRSLGSSIGRRRSAFLCSRNWACRQPQSHPYLPSHTSLSLWPQQDIIEFIFFPVVNEGCRVIAEGIVEKPGDLDVATVMSMGFPAYRVSHARWSWSQGKNCISVSPTLCLYTQDLEAFGYT